MKSNIHEHFDFHAALWKCGKRSLHRWKTDIHGPMEKPPAFPQPANIVSHSFADMAVYTHSHSACCCEHPSCPILIEREKREQKKKRERHPRPKPKAALPLCCGKVFKTASLRPSNQRRCLIMNDMIKAERGKIISKKTTKILFVMGIILIVAYFFLF